MPRLPPLSSPVRGEKCLFHKEVFVWHGHCDVTSRPSASPNLDDEVDDLSALLATGDADKRLREIVPDIRVRHPEASDVDLVDLITAACCPVMNRKDLSESEKAAAVDAFAKRTLDLLQRDQAE